MNPSEPPESLEHRYRTLSDRLASKTPPDEVPRAPVRPVVPLKQRMTDFAALAARLWRGLEPWTRLTRVARSPWTIGIVTTLIALGFAGPFLYALALHALQIVLEAVGTPPGAYLALIGELKQTDEEKFFANVRNLALVAVGLIGLPLAIWRSWLAYQQTKTANTQAETANKQAKIAETGLIIDRFQKGAAMLDSAELSVRLAGIYALRELAMSDPNETYIMVQDLLCDFIRERSKERRPDLTKISKAKPQPGYGPFPPDLQKALETLSGLRNTVPGAKALEQAVEWRADLGNANLSGAKLSRANLSGAILEGAKLSGAKLSRANLSGAVLISANLSGANLGGANLSGAVLATANLSGANLYSANLSGAALVTTNLTGARLPEVILDDEIIVHGIWAYADTPPRNMPEAIARRLLGSRKRGEDWKAFINRMKETRPEPGGWIFESFFSPGD